MRDAKVTHTPFPLFARSILRPAVAEFRARHWREIPLENTTTIFFTTTVLIKAWLVRGRVRCTLARAERFFFSYLRAAKKEVAAWEASDEGLILFFFFFILQREESATRENCFFFLITLDEEILIFDRVFELCASILGIKEINVHERFSRNDATDSHICNLITFEIKNVTFSLFHKLNYLLAIFIKSNLYVL